MIGLSVTFQRTEETTSLRLRVQLSLHGVTLADDTYMVQGTQVQRQIALDRAGMMDREKVLWSPEHPNLVDATLTLLAVFAPLARKQDERLDEVHSYIGLRTVGLDNGHVLLNESWGVPDVARDPAQRHYVQALYYLTKALDQTRPVIGNDGWEQVVSDIYSVHDYSFEGAPLRERYGSLEAAKRTLREVQP